MPKLIINRKEIAKSSYITQTKETHILGCCKQSMLCIKL